MDYLVLPEHCGQIVNVICGDRVTAADCGDRSVVGEPRKVCVDAGEIAVCTRGSERPTAGVGQAELEAMGKDRQRYSVDYLASVITTTGERRGVAASPGRIARGNVWRLHELLLRGGGSPPPG